MALLSRVSLAVPAIADDVAPLSILGLDVEAEDAHPRPAIALTAISMARTGSPFGHRAGAVASQWLLVSDIGLSAFQGRGGLSVVARSLADAGPVPGLEVRPISRGNGILAEAVTDEQGPAVFEPGEIAGTGSRTPVMMTAFRPPIEAGGAPSAEAASSAGADFAFLSLTGLAHDLADRGVAGRCRGGAFR